MRARTENLTARLMAMGSGIGYFGVKFGIAGNVYCRSYHYSLCFREEYFCGDIGKSFEK